MLKQKKQKNNDDGWYIADWEGDPGRTLVLEHAKKYKTKKGAKVASVFYQKRFSHIRAIDLEIVKDDGSQVLKQSDIDEINTILTELEDERT